MNLFTISGEYLTESARDMVVSGNWRGGLRLLTEGLDGVPYPTVVAILRGQERLVGRDELTLEDEDPDTQESYTADVRSVYIDGRLLHDGKRYKLYGQVSRLPAPTSYEWETATWKLTTGRARYPRIRNSKESDLREFVRPFCQNPDDDLILPVRGHAGRAECVYALFERDYDEVDLPAWMPNALPSSPQVAFDSMRGCIAEYGPEVEDSGAVAADPVLKAEIAPPPPAVTSPAESNSNWYLGYRSAVAQQQALDAGFASVEAYSAALRAPVLAALAARGDTWQDFAYSDADGVPRILRYPKNLATSYALMATAARGMAPSWEPVSPPDLKMTNDNRTHTDLWLALGFDLDGAEYEHAAPACTVLEGLVTHLQKTLLSYELHVLTAADKTAVTGRVVRHDDPELERKLHEGNVMLWVPHAGTEYAVLAEKCVAVLCDVGGKLAHLVIVGRETGLPVVRIPAGSKPILVDVPARLDLASGTLAFFPPRQPGAGNV